MLTTLRDMSYLLFDYLHCLISSYALYTQGESLNAFLNYVSERDKFSQVFATLPDSMVEVLLVNGPSPRRWDVVEPGENDNAVSAPTTAPALVAAVYSKSNGLYSSSLLRSDLSERISSLKLSHLIGQVGAPVPKRQKTLDQFVQGPTKVVKDVGEKTENDMVDMVEISS